MRHVLPFALLLTLLVGCNLYTDLDLPNGSTPVADSGDSDAGDSDGGDSDGGANSCTPQTDLDFCNVNGADCGDVTGFDNCGSSRTVDCGVCADGSTCGERQANVCGCPCDIDGTCVADGAINPDNDCEACNQAANANGWTPRTGNICTNDDLCAAEAACTDQGACETTTPVDCSAQVGECIDATCDPADGICKGEPVTDGTMCSLDGISCTADTCQTGICEHPPRSGFCVADGLCLVDGESPAGNSCTTCDASTNPSTLVNTAMGTSCGPTLACATSTCDGMGTCEATVDAGSCAIDGVCFTDGTMNPNNRCQFCVAATSQTEWTNEPSGSDCRSPNCTCGISPFTNEFTCLRPNDSDCN
jgi:hypothetical protein